MRIRCPRCKAAFRDQEYEGEQVHFCPSCFGHWLTRSQLDKIVNTVEYKFSGKTEERVIGTMTAVGDEHVLVDETNVVSCPECEKDMVRGKYVPNCPVHIDECPEHGIWLDTGEIKDLQVFVERKILGIKH